MINIGDQTYHVSPGDQVVLDMSNPPCWLAHGEIVETSPETLANLRINKYPHDATYSFKAGNCEIPLYQILPNQIRVWNAPTATKK